ncbi:MAG: restriction endonuclease [Apibacter sp.]|jgi:restriction system protein|nr:restriction endonuclease [Apibacter sp.]
MIKIPLYPEYSRTIELLKIIEGINTQDFKNMWNTVWGLRGTPQNTVDWKDPDSWIYERLDGKDKEIALKIWLESNKKVNPRWTRGDQFLMSGYKLIEEVKGVYLLTEIGKIFVSSIQNEVIKQIDLEEGLIQILVQLSLLNKGKRSDLLEDWEEYTRNNSNLKQDSVIKDYLRRRLVNLIDRKYVKREGNIYFITDKGISYLEKVNKNNPKPILNKETELNKLIDQFTIEQRQILKNYLKETTPYQFEHIIKDLLTSMGYDEVEVTSPTNDKGVDVTGISQNGITTVKEVIQVKRMLTSNVNRTVLDSLRGSLHRFDAFQGTIITLSDFAKGAKEAAFEKGAAPITLINGEKLIDLLLQYEIGIKRKTFRYYIVDENYFNNEDENVD